MEFSKLLIQHKDLKLHTKQIFYKNGLASYDKENQYANKL